MDDMRKMVYQQFALQVIQQLCVGPNLVDSDTMLKQGSNGLSFDIILILNGCKVFLTGMTASSELSGIIAFTDS